MMKLFKLTILLNAILTAYCCVKIAISYFVTSKIMILYSAPFYKTQHFSKQSSEKSSKCRTKLRYPCKTRSGMTCAVDTAWHKRGFDSLTCKSSSYM